MSTPTATPTATPSTATAMTAADRCDRCGARAQVRAVLPTGGELLFCGHHGRKHSTALAEQGARVHDSH